MPIKMFILLYIATRFMHSLADYHLQGCLSFLKTRKWWEENAPEEKYKEDYKTALAAHAFEWSCFIMLPITVWRFVTLGAIGWEILILFLLNWILHYIIDDMKANLKILNLEQDQFLHGVQILSTLLLLSWVF